MALSLLIVLLGTTLVTSQTPDTFTLDVGKGATTTLQATATPSLTNACKSEPYDIVFLLDSSSSEGSANFKKQLDFVNKFVDAFDIGPNAAQFGIVTYSSTVHNRFFLNDYKDKAALKAAISSVPYTSGNTATGDGLEFIRTNTLSASHGARPNVKKVVIVMTDGQSQDKVLTAQRAKLLKDTGVKVIAIGIGSGINSAELQSIATDPQHVFMVAGFNVLQTIEKELQKKTCTTPACKSEPYDIVFLLDSSSSEGSANFKKQLDFVSKFVDAFNIGPSAAQFGIVTFSTAVHNRFFLNDFKDKAALKAAISSVPYTSGNTDTGDGLEFIRINTLSASHGARPNANQVVIVMTDGQSQRTTVTAQQAKLLQDAGVKVIAVGIGNGINSAELQSIASDPQHVFMVAGFNVLQTIEKELQKTTCTTPPTCKSEPYDIVFLLDSSTSEGSTNFKKQLDFVNKFVDAFDIGPNAAQFGIVTFSSTVHNRFYLNNFQDKAALKAAVSRVPYTSGNTATGDGLEFIRTNTLSASHGARPQVNKVVIVMTDGQSQDTRLTAQRAKTLKDTGVKVIAIGIGSGINSAELRSIATDPQHVFLVAGFDVLHTIQKELQKKTCTQQVQTTGPSSISHQ